MSSEPQFRRQQQHETSFSCGSFKMQVLEGHYEVIENKDEKYMLVLLF